MLQLFNQFAVFTKTLGSNTAGKWEKCAAIHAADLRYLIEDFPDVRCQRWLMPCAPAHQSTYLLLLRRHTGLVAVYYKRQVARAESALVATFGRQFGDCSSSEQNLRFAKWAKKHPPHLPQF